MEEILKQCPVGRNDSKHIAMTKEIIYIIEKSTGNSMLLEDALKEDAGFLGSSKGEDFLVVALD